MSGLVNRILIISVVVLSGGAENPKKGFGICSTAYKCDDTYSITDASWWYDWRYDQGEVKWNNCSRQPRPGYVPMIFGKESAYSAVIPTEAEYVLGFNEPNAGNQANLTAKEAAALWPLVEQKAEGKLLVSPALYGCDTQVENCIAWYEEFFNACPSCRVDRIAVHGYHCVPYMMIQSLGKLASHFNRRIWLTEFSCFHSNVDGLINFMNDLVPLLDAASFVERYSWFCSRVQQPTNFSDTDLLEQNSSKLSRLGENYNSL